ncbi:MAG: hypothetical protein LUF28_05955 [Clostridiales bacterium]|nr:hypothetical protein [Clostridiales bacterium]
MMEYEKLYETLTPALRRWCNQAASGAAEDDRYLVRQRPPGRRTSITPSSPPTMTRRLRRS